MFLIGGTIDFVKIIEWCNANNGFLTALLALLSTFISTLAIIVSVRTAQLPYKKSVYVDIFFPIRGYWQDDGSWSGTEPYSANVRISNTGNRNIMIETVWLKIVNIKYGMSKTKFFIPPQTVYKQILPAQSHIVQFDKKNMSKILDDNDKNDFIYVYIGDSEGELHSKCVGRIKQLKKRMKQAIKYQTEANNKAKTL